MPTPFESSLHNHAAAVETVLTDILNEIEPDTPPRLIAAMRHGLLAGGKRLRPCLVMMTADLFGTPSEQSLRAAAALECVHSYSLIHDDLPAMDDDDLRRGQPTVHIAFDEATAILAGDALLTLAFEILADPRTHRDADLRCRLALELAQAAGSRGMAGGQMLDLAAETEMPDEAGIVRLQRMKTGALLRHACRAGAILGCAGEVELAALTAYGEAIGAAFQIADDILDVESSAEELGKAANKDAAAGKATLVGLLGVDKARRRLAALVDQALAALEPFGENAEGLRDAARFVMMRRK